MNTRLTLGTIVALCALLTSCAHTDAEKAPLAAEPAGFHRAVTTKSPSAQDAFDRGLLACFAFNHEQAIAAFQEAVSHDPSCGMAWWGQALAAGPNINNAEMTPDSLRMAVDAVGRARILAPAQSPVERELIEALSKRYTDPPPADRAALDRAYADAMREVWRRHPDDADVAALFAESMMDLRPWDLWTPAGEPQPGTLEIVSTLEAARRLAPDHPGALHYTIHTLEASPEPGRALPAADRLRDLVPDAGHLVHMPSHIDIRIGHYEEAMKANRRGIAADLRLVERVGRGHFYDLYRAHNYHFLVYAAMFDGQSRVAIEAARELQRELAPMLATDAKRYVDGFVATPYSVLVRFGHWQEMLNEPAPDPELKYTVAMWHHARGMAFASLGHPEQASAELAAFNAAAKEIAPSVHIGNNAAQTVLDVGRPLLEGEIAYRLGHFDEAFERLREGVARDDALKYDEPWGWMQPVRHALGALLLEQGRAEEALAVYEADLRAHPENGWSLTGLADALTRMGRLEEAKVVEARFAKAWERSDTRLPGSCFCKRPR